MTDCKRYKIAKIGGDQTPRSYEAWRVGKPSVCIAWNTRLAACKAACEADANG